MTAQKYIDSLISNGCLGEALDALTENMSHEPDNALWPYLRGKVHWKAGDRASAISDYKHAVSLDPHSPAQTALEMSQQIMDFFNPDMFNP